MMLTQLADVARRTGHPVVEVDGWRTRGHGPQTDVRTIVCHHTANGGAPGDYPSLGTVRDGRPGLFGPLAQLGLGRSGTIYVIAAGLCYHAGVSRETSYTNAHSIGIEAEAVGVPGTRGDWPAVQMDAYARLCAVLVDHFDLAAADVRGHKETAAPVGRKSDPDFDMPAFRDRIAAVNLRIAPTSQEDDMQWTDKIPLTAKDAEIWGTGPDGKPYREGDLVTFGAMVRYPTLARKLERELTELKAESQARHSALLAAIRAIDQDA